MAQRNAQNDRQQGLKSWRIVVRNLPFDTKEEDLKVLFGKYGIIKEINLPKCKDKKFPNSCAGFCFLQYEKKKSADFAKELIPTLEFKSRKLTTDWALDKDTFVTKAMDGSEKQIMVKKLESIINQKNQKKTNFKKSKNDLSDKSENEEKKDCVVFLRNIDFGVTNESLKEMASQFGNVVFSILCNYPGTDQPCGTAFVHFEEKSAADACLNELLKADGVFLNNRQIFGYRAVTREEAAEFKKDTKKQPKDNRNLHLLRVSLIREGTSNARGMSEQDIELRKRLAIVARNKLKDLTMFVSPSRLAIHNIPFTMNEDKLNQVCFEAVKNPNAKITECRIMRDKVGVNERGRAIFGRSKGYGFLAFSDHADALKCLQNLNNNADTFTNERRPIVDFSIESLAALRIKESRLQKKDTNSMNNFRTQKKELNDNRIMKRGMKRPAPNDPLALQETKRSLISSGQKWMPKRLGAKIRHRDLKKEKKQFGAKRKLKK